MNGIVFLQVPITGSRRPAQESRLDLGPDPMAQDWLHLGVRAALEDNREDARYYFVQAVRTDLNYARAWLYLGGVADDPALTLSCLQKALQLDPEEAQAWEGLVWARNKLGLQLPLPPPPASVAHARPDGGDAAPPAQPPRAPWLSAPAALWDNLPALPPLLASESAAAWDNLPALSPTARVEWHTPPPRPANAPASWPVPPAQPPAGVAWPVRAADRTVSVLPPWLRDLAPTTPATAPLQSLDLEGWGAPAPSATEEDAQESTRLLRQGVTAAADGARVWARYWFLKAIAADSTNTRAWLYLGGVAGDPGITLACMERVLLAEQDNREAQAGAAWAARKLETPPAGAEP